MTDSRGWQITIYVNADRIDPAGLVDRIEALICPDPEGEDHRSRCPLYAISSTPLTDETTR